jgi:hypothetical protein
VSYFVYLSPFIKAQVVKLTTQREELREQQRVLREQLNTIDKDLNSIEQQWSQLQTDTQHAKYVLYKEFLYSFMFLCTGNSMQKCKSNVA